MCLEPIWPRYPLLRTFPDRGKNDQSDTASFLPLPTPAPNLTPTNACRCPEAKKLLSFARTCPKPTRTPACPAPAPAAAPPLPLPLPPCPAPAPAALPSYQGFLLPVFS